MSDRNSLVNWQLFVVILQLVCVIFILNCLRSQLSELLALQSAESRVRVTTRPTSRLTTLPHIIEEEYE